VSSNGYAKDPEQRLGGILATLAPKYIWWKKSDDASLTPRRLIAQIMDIGVFDDVQRVAEEIGDDALRDAVAHAEAGWFSPRSWTYWHYRLGLVEPGGVMPELPRRRFR
jgi:hypothetical protein